MERLRELYESLRQGKIQLEEVLRQSDEYEKKKRVLRIRELMLSYQALREKEEEEKQTKNRYQALKDQYGRLTERRESSSGSRKPHRNACELQKITIWSRECRKAWIP